jgi:hypothetical protein
LANTNITLTTPSIASTGTGTSSMTVATNALSGYSVSYSGTTLTSWVRYFNSNGYTGGVNR